MAHLIKLSTSMPLDLMPATSVQRMPSIHSITITLELQRSWRTQGILTVGSVAKLRRNSSMLRASCGVRVLCVVCV